ncbi:MAG TPA: MBL fold metallo-hydrolase [Candidatus Angelobacter sp.]|nr:MBL fold metallo-hydrolase [Candidatus Angelobacter sp.]
MSKSAFVTQDVVRIHIGIANAYIIGYAREWILVDTGTPGNADKILKTTAEHMGPGSVPIAIVLTHGHFDHSGSARELAAHWGVKIYVHHREKPFVNGTSKYPPPDPTVGGFMAQVIRFVPNTSIDLQPWLRELPGSRLPWLQEWQVIETPGHTAGHISLFRESDGTLLAGDAFTTIDQDRMPAALSQAQKVCRPPAYYTPDWELARSSVEKLAALNPRILAAGHGKPMAGEDALQQLRELARDFPVPEHGRYVAQPAQLDENGIAYLPPPAPDPVRRNAMISAAGVSAIGLTVWLNRRGRAQVDEGVVLDRAA